MDFFESISDDQVADHIVALIQTRHVRIQGARRGRGDDWGGEDNWVLVQDDMSNAYGSTSRLDVLEAVRRHLLSVVPLCVSHFVVLCKILDPGA